MARASRLAAAALVLLAVAGIQSGVAGAEVATFADATGDHRREDAQPGQSGAADITGVRVVHGASELTLSMELADEPSTEYRTSGFFDVRWLLEFDDTQPGHDAEINVSTLGSSVLEYAHRVVGGDRINCEVTGGLVGRRVSAYRIPVGCAGGGGPLRVAAEVSYDDPNDGDSLFEGDAAPDRGDDAEVTYSEPIPRTERSAPRPVRRLAGEDRFATSVAVSRARTPEPDPRFGAYRVLLARSDDPADALAAGNTQETVLLVPSCGRIPGIVLDELARLTPRQVIALGGERAVCDQVLADAVTAAGDAEADRLAGPTRFETAVAIGRATAPDTCDDGDCPARGDVYLARGDDFADALSAAPLRAGPLLLVPQCGEVPASVLDAVDSGRFSVERIVVLGGEAAVCDDVVGQVVGAAGDPDSQRAIGTSRLAGPDRVSTALAISQSRYPSGALEVALATAADFPDALTGGSLVDGPVLLVPSGCDLPPAVEEEITRLNPASITVLGGERAVCSDVAERAAR